MVGIEGAHVQGVFEPALFDRTRLSNISFESPTKSNVSLYTGLNVILPTELVCDGMDETRVVPHVSAQVCFTSWNMQRSSTQLNSLNQDAPWSAG